MHRKTREQQEEDARKKIEDLKLSHKQQLFIYEYSRHYNLSKASRATKLSRSYCYALLKQESTLQALEVLQSLAVSFETITPASLVGQMAIWSRVNVADFYHDNGTAKGLNEITREQASCIKEVRHKFDKYGERHITFVFHDPKKANKLLSDAFGLYSELNTKNENDEIDNMTAEQLEEFIENTDVVDAPFEISADKNTGTFNEWEEK